MKNKKIILLAITFTYSVFSANEETYFSDLTKLNSKKQSVMAALDTCSLDQHKAQLAALQEIDQATEKLKQEAIADKERWCMQSYKKYEEYDTAFKRQLNSILQQQDEHLNLMQQLTSSADSYINELNQQVDASEQSSREKQQKIINIGKIQIIRHCNYVRILDEDDKVSKVHQEKLASCHANSIRRLSEFVNNKDHSTRDACVTAFRET